jgi:hypothetical protein
MLPELPPSYPATRDALHALAEQLVSAAYWQATTHIGLRPTPRGFGTPVFGDNERVRVDATAIVHERGGESRRHELTTLRAASSFLGVPLGAPSVYTPATTLPPDTPLAIDRDAALALADWYALAAALLQDLRAAHPDAPSTELQIWPEHFDLACELGDDAVGARANYGASPGDAGIPEPYLYVGPHEPSRRTGVFTRCAFGAAITYSELRRVPEAGSAGRQFYESAVAELVG